MVGSSHDQRAFSMKTPWICTPSSGCDSTTEVSYTSVTSMCTRIWSSEYWLMRAVTCSEAVTKPIGLKQPEIHTDGGSDSMGLVGADHSSSCCQRSLRSSNQLELLLRLYVPVGPIWPHVFSHEGGTWFMKSAVMRPSMASEILSAPERPRASSLRFMRIIPRILFIRSSSCRMKTTYGEPFSLMRMRISTMLKSSRSPSRIAVRISETFDSLDWPPPPPPPPPTERIEKKSPSASALSSEISALACMPKIAGASGGERSSMNMRKSA
mmetsp:Transcript_20344/g.41586  ORF Transcript_20344/g.41586 Transcript_20344/m.41586 type:complete len:268 (+) Transcript_20344:88-891(+)